jgi:tetratricopeptide (TPR) repeat protein
MGFSRSLLCAFLVLFCCGCGDSSTDRVRELEVIQLFQAGEVEESEKLFRKILAEKKRNHGPDSPQVATSYGDYGAALLVGRRLEEAEKCLRKAVHCWQVVEENEELIGQYRSRYVRALENLSAVCQLNKDFEEAEALLTRASALRKEPPAPDHPEALKSLYSMGYLHQQQGRFAEAESLMSLAVELGKQAERRDIPQLATHTYQLARIYQVQGKNEAALVTFLEARDLAETVPNLVAHGVDMYRSGLAFAYLDVDSLALAGNLFELCLANTISTHGEESLEYAMRAANLADFYIREKRFSEALPLLEKSVALYEKSYLAGHPSVGEMKQSLEMCRHEVAN